jgi:predicted acyl esterase
MPFVEQYRRDNIDNILLHQDVQPGDRCYVYYKQMVDQWRAKPRWTTAHEIYSDMLINSGGHPSQDDKVAKELAWQVFFNIHVMDYERKKQYENGDI